MAEKKYKKATPEDLDVVPPLTFFESTDGLSPTTPDTPLSAPPTKDDLEDPAKNYVVEDAAAPQENAAAPQENAVAPDAAAVATDAAAVAPAPQENAAANPAQLDEAVTLATAVQKRLEIQSRAGTGPVAQAPAEGGRRRSKRRHPKKGSRKSKKSSARKSKKGGRSRKNGSKHRKHSRAHKKH